MQWGYSSHFASHPRVTWTIFLLHCYFWWPMSDKGTGEFMVAFVVCARGKALHQAPVVLLQPWVGWPYLNQWRSILVLLLSVSTCPLSPPSKPLPPYLVDWEEDRLRNVPWCVAFLSWSLPLPSVPGPLAQPFFHFQGCQGLISAVNSLYSCWLFSVKRQNLILSSLCVFGASICTCKLLL